MSSTLTRSMKVIVLAMLALMLSLTGYSPAHAQTPPAPSLDRAVVDETDTLSGEQISDISAAINNSKRDKNQPQIAVLMVNHVPKGETLEQASRDVARAWGVGNRDKDNGVLFYIAKDDHLMRFEVARGVNDELTDTRAKAILDQIVAPEFRENRYAEGITQGVQSARAIVSGKSFSDLMHEKQESQKAGIPMEKVMPWVLGIGAVGVGTGGVIIIVQVVGHKRRKKEEEKREHENGTRLRALMDTLNENSRDMGTDTITKKSQPKTQKKSQSYRGLTRRKRSSYGSRSSDPYSSTNSYGAYGAYGAYGVYGSSYGSGYDSGSFGGGGGFDGGGASSSW